MNDYREPRNGDFVAYIDALQRESAARLHLRPQTPGIEAATHGHESSPSSPAVGEDGAKPVLTRQQAEELMARLANPARSASTGRAAIGLAAGLLLIAFWFVADAGAVPFLIGIALLAWSVSRLRTLVRDAAPGQRERAQVAQLFGKKPAA
jgi:hypothetical protein